MTVETNSPTPPWTILKLLDWSRGYFSDRGIDSARLDAELLLGSALGLQRVQLYAQFDRPLDPDELGTYRALVKRRALGEPVAYLIGKKGFWTFEVDVDPRVLIPRPETESVVEAVIGFGDTPTRIVDVGTGSGILAIALALEFPDADVIATDIDQGALHVAKLNVESLAPAVTVKHSDLLDGVDGVFDLIVSNPPYVGRDDAALEEAVRTHEPHVALFADDSGFAIYERLIPQAFEKLRPAGRLVLEIGHEQAAAVSEAMKSVGFTEISVRQDLGGRDRVCSGKKAADAA